MSSSTVPDRAPKRDDANDPDGEGKKQNVGQGVWLAFDGLDINQSMQNNENEDERIRQMEPFPCGATQPFFRCIRRGEEQADDVQNRNQSQVVRYPNQ